MKLRVLEVTMLMNGDQIGILHELFPGASEYQQSRSLVRTWHVYNPSYSRIATVTFVDGTISTDGQTNLGYSTREIKGN